jgi:hypothetical protein
MEKELRYYHAYATELYERHTLVQKVRVQLECVASRADKKRQALGDVYGDILRLCTEVNRVFKNKRGSNRSKCRERRYHSCQVTNPHRIRCTKRSTEGMEPVRSLDFGDRHPVSRAPPPD